MSHFAGDRYVHERTACVSHGDKDKDGKNVCMCIHKTACGADRLLNLQHGTGEKEDKDRQRKLGVRV